MFKLLERFETPFSLLASTIVIAVLLAVTFSSSASSDTAPMTLVPPAAMTTLP